MSDATDAQQAIQSLYELYADDVYRYAVFLIGDKVDAHDVVQEVFMRAFRSWSNYRMDAKASTWIMSITRNYIYDLFRKKKVHQNFLSGYEPVPPTDETSSLTTTLVIQQAISALKTDYRHVVVLRYVEGFSVKETAEILGWSEMKVRNTARRAIIKLKDIMVGESDENRKRSDKNP